MELSLTKSRERILREHVDNPAVLQERKNGMTLQQIGYFLKLAEELNFTNVAKIFFITQPTLSRQIVNLENELHSELFIREHNTVGLTESGKIFYDKMKPLFLDMMEAIRSVQSMNEEKKSIVIGIQEEQLMNNSLVLAISKLRHNHPEIKVSIQRCGIDELLEGLENGKFDLINVLIFEKHNSIGEKIDYVELCREPTYVISSKNNMLSENRELTKQEFGQLLKKYPLLLSDSFGHMDVDMPQKVFADNFGIDEKDVDIILSGSLLSMPIQVSTGLGLSIGNKSSFFSIDPEINMYRIIDTEDSYSKGLMFSRPVVNPYAKELIALATEEEKIISKA